MHTQDKPEVNVELVEELKDRFTWEPFLSTESIDEGIAGPEDILVEDIDKAFDDLKAQLCEEKNAAGPAQEVEDGNEILEGKIYDLTELEEIDKGIAPVNATEDLDIIGDEGGFGWDVNMIMVSKGVL